MNLSLKSNSIITAFDTCLEAAGGTLEALLVFLPIMLGTFAAFTNDTSLDPFLPDKLHTGRLLRKPIDKVDDIHGQNRLF